MEEGTDQKASEYFIYNFKILRRNLTISADSYILQYLPLTENGEFPYTWLSNMQAWEWDFSWDILGDEPTKLGKKANSAHGNALKHFRTKCSSVFLNYFSCPNKAITSSHGKQDSSCRQKAHNGKVKEWRFIAWCRKQLQSSLQNFKSLPIYLLILNNFQTYK